MTTLAQMTERVRGKLDQYVSNRAQTATLVSDSDSTITITPVQGAASLGGSALVEIGSELIQIASYDSATGVCVVPAWGRAQMGTSQATAGAGAKVTINPLWPFWFVAQSVIDGLHAMYPALFAVKNVELTSDSDQEKYLMPADAEDILDARIQWWAPTQPERQITRFTLDTSNLDGNRYLHIPTLGVSGRPIFVTYRAIPTYPTGPTDTGWTFEDSGYPSSAIDLPILRAAADLIVSAETSRLQNYSSEQSDRARFVQGGTGNSVSRRLDEQYRNRLMEERARILDRYPPRIRRTFVG